MGRLCYWTQDAEIETYVLRPQALQVKCPSRTSSSTSSNSPVSWSSLVQLLEMFGSVIKALSRPHRSAFTQPKLLVMTSLRAVLG